VLVLVLVTAAEAVGAEAPALAGAFGGALGISQNATIFMQLAAGLYMIAVALNLFIKSPSCLGVSGVSNVKKPAAFALL
jgi:hypothetical protein